MRKGTRLEDLEQKLRMIGEATNIAVTGFFLMGYPGEEEADVEATVRLALRLPLDKALFAFALPHPGTELHRTYIRTQGAERQRGQGWENRG